MRVPELYERIDEERARRELLSDARPIVTPSRGLAPWWITLDSIMCFARVGRWRPGPLEHSLFRTAIRFAWFASDRLRVEGVDDYPLVPREIRARETGGRALHLFVRSGDEAFTYLGEMGAAHSYGGNRENQSADFELRRAVPSSVLSRFGLVPESPPDTRSLDAELHSLLERNLAERMRCLQHLAEYWHGPLSSADGYGARDLENIPMPAALRAWYSAGGRRAEVFNAQNILLEPSELRAEDGKLVFYRENQCVWEMATRPDGEDPPVWCHETKPWIEQPAPLSITLIHACIFEATMQAMYGGCAPNATDALVRAIERNVRELPYGGWLLPYGPTRFFASEGAFAVIMTADEIQPGLTSAWVAARTEHPLQFLRATDAGLWDYAAF